MRRREDCAQPVGPRVARMDLPIIVVSSGEPAGIGPDICVALARHVIRARLAVLGDPELLDTRAAALGTRVALRSACRP